MIERKITENEYLIATFGALAMFVAVYVFVLLISCVLCIHDIRAPPQSERDRLAAETSGNLNSIEAEVATDELNTSEGENVEIVRSTEEVPETEDDHHRGRRKRRNGNVVHDDEDGVNGIVTIASEEETLRSIDATVEDARSEDSSIVDFADADLLPDADVEKDVFRTKTSITVSDLARKSPRVLAREGFIIQTLKTCLMMS